MDTPDTTPIQTVVEGGPWPSSSAPLPPQPPDATITLPGSAPETAPTPNAPTTEQYQALIEAHGIQGMAASELAAIYDDASHVVRRYGGNAFQEQEGLGNDPDVLRALARVGKDMKVYEDAFNQQFPTLPEGTRVQTPPLEGPALAAAIEQLLTDYLDGPTRRKLDLAGALTSWDGWQFLAKLATSRHRLTTALAAVDRIQPEVRARAESARGHAALQALAPSVRALSEAEFKERSHSLFDEIDAAKEAGHFGTAERLQRQHDDLFRARYSGKH